MHGEFDSCNGFIADTWRVVVISRPTRQFATHQGTLFHHGRWLLCRALVSMRSRFVTSSSTLKIGSSWAKIQEWQPIGISVPGNFISTAHDGNSSRSYFLKANDMFAEIRYLSKPFFFLWRFMRRVADRQPTIAMCDLSSCPNNAARLACISPDRDGAPIIFPESREVFSREGAKTRAPSADGWRVASASVSRHRSS